MLLWLAAAAPTTAQGLIRDAEIERTIDLIAAPIFRAANLNTSRVQVLILNNRRLNAFAAGNNILLNSGLLQRLDTVDQVRAVLAHEAGHIVGGHIARRDDQIRRARGTTALGVLLAIAAGVAAGPEAAVAASSVSRQVAERNFLAHSRSEEGAADQASLRFMVAAGADPRAILEVMRLFRGQEILSARSSDPYVRTHPLWAQRIRYLEEQVANTARGRPVENATAYWHARMVTKLDAFLANPRRVLRAYEQDRTEIGALARAVAYHRIPDRRSAREAMNALLQARPDDPFYNELNGQFLLENGDAAGAVTAYRRAAQLAPNQPLILSGLGRALVAVDTPAATREALDVLTRARTLDKADARALRNLAVVYARSGNQGQASLATAERMVLLGRLRDAMIHAERAKSALSAGSPGHRRADDILRSARRAVE